MGGLETGLGVDEEESRKDGRRAPGAGHADECGAEQASAAHHPQAHVGCSHHSSPV